jgi:hypothetical protein
MPGRTLVSLAAGTGSTVRRVAAVLGGAVLAAAVLTAAAERPAVADPGDAACTVRVIHAKKTGELDKELEALRPQFTKPPLDSFKGFSLLKRHELQLRPGAEPTKFELPNGQSGSLEFDGKAESPPDGGHKTRLKLKLQLHDVGARLLSTRLLLNDGGTVLQGGIKHEDGTLVLGITCRILP